MAFRGIALLFIGLLVGAEYVQAAEQVDDASKHSRNRFIFGKTRIPQAKIRMPDTGTFEEWGVQFGNSLDSDYTTIVTHGGTTELQPGDMLVKIKDQGGSKGSGIDL